MDSEALNTGYAVSVETEWLACLEGFLKHEAGSDYWKMYAILTLVHRQI